MNAYLGLLFASASLDPGHFLLADQRNRKPIVYLVIAAAIMVASYYTLWPYDPLSYAYMPHRLFELSAPERLLIGVPGLAILFFITFSVPLIPTLLLTSGTKHLGALYECSCYVFATCWLYFWLFLIGLALAVNANAGLTPQNNVELLLLVTAFLCLFLYRFFRTFLEVGRALAFAQTGVFFFATLAVGSAVFTQAVHFYYIRGNAMAPNLIAGDVIFVARHPFSAELNPKRGDIIIYEKIVTGPGAAISRILAVPGEKIRMREGHVFIDGAVLGYSDAGTLRNVWWTQTSAAPLRATRESFRDGYQATIVSSMNNPSLADASDESFSDYALKPCEYYVLSDNRPNARDSREEMHGAVRCREIDGVAVGKMFPLFRTTNVLGAPR